MSTQANGAMAMLVACVIWGFSPLYYAEIKHVPPLEILSHRTIWSFVTFTVVLAVLGRLRHARDILATRRRLAFVFLAGIMIATNWGVFVFSVATERVTESSLGYYFFPCLLYTSPSPRD